MDLEMGDQQYLSDNRDQREQWQMRVVSPAEQCALLFALL